MSEQHDTRAHREHSGQRLKDTFTAAVELPAGERSAMLDRACAGDAALRARVEDLLRVHDAGAAFLANPTQHERAGMSTALGPITEGPGSRVGRYKVLQLIGEGGFGSVFLAEQSEPVRRRVALKIIKLGMDTRSVIARFEAERQALALMDHPHIARVLDAGATDTGRPFFAMEYVTGDAVTAFANAHRLHVTDRLALFAQVCSAVQHAHTKGVIHRDIKPGNVLVSMVDGKPFAKVIDFGIAKATAAPLTDKTLFTEHRQLIGTPEYMSPEQAEGSPDIDTRTDVYALGVLLYELLTGDTPFDARRLRSAAWVEMQRIIREEEPPMPSLRLMKPALVEEPSAPQPPALPHASAAPSPRSRVGLVGHIDPRAIKGELDWIVMKALDKDRARRYETASALAADVERHMKGEAVIAAPVSRVYRVRKFVRKHKGVVTATGAVVTALAVGGGGMAWQWREARKQRDVVISTFEQVAVDLATDDSASGHVPEDGVYYFLGESTAQGAYGVRVRQDRSSGQPEVVYTTGNMSSTHELSRSSVPADFVGRTLRRLTNEIVNERAERTKSIDAANAQLRAQNDVAKETFGRLVLNLGAKGAEHDGHTTFSIRVPDLGTDAVGQTTTIAGSEHSTELFLDSDGRLSYLQRRMVNGDETFDVAHPPENDVVPLLARFAEKVAIDASENARALETSNAELRMETRRARLAEAQATVRESEAVDLTMNPAGLIERLQMATTSFSELLGPRNVWTCRARAELAPYLGTEHDIYRARCEYSMRSDELHRSLEAIGNSWRTTAAAGIQHPTDLVLLAIIRWKVALSNVGIIDDVRQVDERFGGKEMTPDEHRESAREALQKARALMSDLANAETWAKDEDAKALVAEAVALIDGGGK